MSIFHDYRGDATNYQPVYAASVLSQQGLRNAFTYYEISVEVRGPTLSSAMISGGTYWDGILDNRFGFIPGRFHYRVGLFSDMSTVTLTATASNSDATISFSPADADTSADGHQINAIPQGVRTVTITVTRGSDTEIYTIEFSQP